MIQPALQEDAFLDDVGTVAKASSPESFHVWWLGQSGYLLHWRGVWVLLDPYLSDSLTRKYAATDKPHTRLTARVVAPERLGFVSIVTSSHNHTDHLDPETLRPLVAANPLLRLVGPEANRATLRERSGLPDEQIFGLDAPPVAGSPAEFPGAGTSWVSLDQITFHAVPAAHEDLARDSAGRHIYLGFIVRFGPWTIYHSGDTVGYPGMVERLRPWKPDLALLPINGRGPERRVAGNLWGREAAALAAGIGARVVIPGHYEMFEFNTATPAEFISTCQALGQSYQVLRAGERWTFPLKSLL